MQNKNLKDYYVLGYVLVGIRASGSAGGEKLCVRRLGALRTKAFSYI